MMLHRHFEVITEQRDRPEAGANEKGHEALAVENTQQHQAEHQEQPKRGRKRTAKD